MNKKLLKALAILSCGFIGLNAYASEPNKEMINNGSFSKGTDGWWAAGAKLKRTDNMGCITFTKKGKNPWDVILGQSDLALKKGQNYLLKFNALAKEPISVKALLQHDGAPYTGHIVEDISLNQELKEFQFTFKPAGNDNKVQFQFQMGTQSPTTVCVKDVSLTMQ